MNRADYLRLIHQIPVRVSGVQEAIAPFGFEALRDWPLSIVKPKRAYIYVQVDRDRELVAAELIGWIAAHRDELALTLESDSVSFVSVDNRRQIQRFTDDPGLAVFVYFLEGCDDSLVDTYATYSALLPVAIADGSLNEMRGFAGNPACRRFVFQATRMFSGTHQLLLSGAEKSSLQEGARRNGSHEPATVSRQSRPASAADWKLLRETVQPHACRLAGNLETGGDRLVNWVDVHSGERVARLANHRIEYVKSRVSDAYRSALEEEPGVA